jgi:hypothetical protein
MAAAAAKSQSDRPSPSARVNPRTIPNEASRFSPAVRRTAAAAQGQRAPPARPTKSRPKPKPAANSATTAQAAAGIDPDGCNSVDIIFPLGDVSARFCNRRPAYGLPPLARRDEPLEDGRQIAHRTTAMAGHGSRLRTEFAAGAVILDHLEQRIIAEAVAAAIVGQVATVTVVFSLGANGSLSKGAGVIKTCCHFNSRRLCQPHGTIRRKNRIKGAKAWAMAGKNGGVAARKTCQVGNRGRHFSGERVCARRLPRSMLFTKERAMRCFWLASIVVLALGAAAESAQADWRTYGTVNRTSPDGVWQRGYGPMGYGWYSAYGDYVGSDYSSIRFGYRNRASGFNFNRIDNYGFADPRAIGDRPR